MNDEIKEYASRFFPHLPEELISDFVYPLLADSCYPVTDEPAFSKWRAIVAPFTISEFREFRWRKCFVAYGDLRMHPITQNDIDIVVVCHTPDVGTVMSWSREFVIDNVMRTKFQVECIESTGNVYASIAAAVTPEGFVKVFDGIHRLAALRLLQMPVSFKIPVWIGSPA